MFLLGTTMFTYILSKYLKLEFRKYILLILLVNILLTFLQIILPETRRYTFAIILIVTIFLEYLYKIKHKSNIIIKDFTIVICILLFFLIWYLDNSKVLCTPTSLFQGHVLWHILNAVAIWKLWRYYNKSRN